MTTATCIELGYGYRHCKIHFKAYSQRLNTNIGKAFHYKMIVSLSFPEQEEQPTGWERRKELGL